MQRIDGRKFMLILTDKQLEELDRIAKRHGKTRAETTRNLLDLGLDVYTDLESAGIPQIAEATRRAKNAIREYLQPRLA